ncbi:hypothetical protein DPMN_114223 [Dreissena polymorpha]|uniref:Uncharacterized protein n=1 Tax=Dreissena polymorpha TaxID=45954 RepID=A0A9D4QS93_DREPO|nr:hypothetical protein DPMN_114223 [Dreissena polymorpha]
MVLLVRITPFSHTGHGFFGVLVFEDLLVPEFCTGPGFMTTSPARRILKRVNCPAFIARGRLEEYFT